MKIHQLSGPPPVELARALVAFEEPFTYPLGPGRFFRISHGADYTAFFRAQGREVCFIAEHDGQVLGALGTVLRKLRKPDGTEQTVAYFGDLKIAQTARGGMILIRLARAAEAWLRPQVQAGFGVVMGGTSLTPEAYTGRVGIPDFRELGRVMVLRISGGNGLNAGPDQLHTTEENGRNCFERLSRGQYACPVGAVRVRSEIEPVWLLTENGSACGMLEDTRRAKRLVSNDGTEMLSAHLSCLAYQTARAGAEVIRAALHRARQLGLPALFASVAEPHAPEFREALREFEVLAAPAIVYGAGLEPGCWNINSAEI